MAGALKLNSTPTGMTICTRLAFMKIISTPNLDKFDQWLKPVGQTLQQLDELLDHKVRTYYSHALAA